MDGSRGEKKHYNHKVDAYSFAIVLWELIHKLPFEGMSNQQAAYAAAFKALRSHEEMMRGHREEKESLILKTRKIIGEQELVY
ncbi:putative dual-specificity kinase TKL-Pl-4 family [Helianthus annuus]|nr:putative dual-specificity kinase TKL-Pl-4 family [Helianthus annuus]